MDLQKNLFDTFMEKDVYSREVWKEMSFGEKSKREWVYGDTNVSADETNMLSDKHCKGGNENGLWGWFWHSQNCYPHFLPHISWTIGRVPPHPCPSWSCVLPRWHTQIKLMKRCRWTDIKREYIYLWVSLEQITLVQNHSALMDIALIWHVHQCMSCLTLQWRQWAADFMLHCTNVLWHGASSVFPKGGKKIKGLAVHVWWAGLTADDAYAPQAHPQRSFMSCCFALCQHRHFPSPILALKVVLCINFHFHNRDIYHYLSWLSLLTVSYSWLGLCCVIQLPKSVW